MIRNKRAFICSLHAGLLLAFAFVPRVALAECEVGEAQSLPASGCNRAFSLHVLDAQQPETLDGLLPPPGQQWLALTVRFENWMPADLVYKMDYQEGLLVGSVRRQLYLLANDQVVARAVLPDNEETPDTFIMPRLGAYQETRVGFAVPEGELCTYSLHYYHDEYATIHVPLKGEACSPDEQRQGAEQIQSNDLMSIGLHALSFHEEWHGQPAPEGMQWLVADLRGQSHWESSIDALAVDRTAAVNEKAPLPRLMEYVQAERMLQVVVDERYGYPRELSLSSLPATPAWMPEYWAGGEAVFAVPEQAKHLALVAYFPGFSAPGIANIKRDRLHFPVADGQSMQSYDDPPLATIADSPTPVTIHEAVITSSYAGLPEVEASHFLVLDVSLGNVSDDNGMMAVSGRYRVSTSTEQGLMPAGVFQPGPFRVNEPFLLPKGEERRFQLVYVLDRMVDEVTLLYGGVSLNESLSLPVTEK